MDQTLVPLEDNYLDRTFEALGKLEIQLDSDPLIYGPKRLNLKTALARQMLTGCERLFLDASQKHAYYKRAHRAATLIFDMKLKHLLANDPDVRSGRAVSEREAMASGKLKDEVKDVADAERALEELDAVLTVIKAKRSDLRDIQGRLRDQVRLCQEEIGLGTRWGSKSPRGVELQPGQGFADGGDVAAISDLIDKVRDVSDSETHLPALIDVADSDEDGDEDASLASNADLGGLETKDAPPPVSKPDVGSVTPVTPPPVNDLIPGHHLVREFGFVPHCEVCGEVQSRCPSGMVCPNGHGGAASVPPPEDALEETNSVGKLPPEGTSDQDAITAFLALGTGSEGPTKSRRQIEEEDEMDIESILVNFEG